MLIKRLGKTVTIVDKKIVVHPVFVQHLDSQSRIRIPRIDRI